MVAAPIAEVHLSAIEEREEWRRRSVISDLAAVRVSGKGREGYAEAVAALADLVADEEQS
jgi:3-dehydroquinate dehydratase-2